MELPLALLSGSLFAGGIYLMLSARLMGFLFGLLMLSNGVNTAIFAAGRLTYGAPPLLTGTPQGELANALPQALLLTAIVIGFGLFAFAVALTIRACASFGTDDADRMRAAEPEAPE